MLEAAAGKAGSDNRPGDVWIMVVHTTYLPEKYLSSFTQSVLIGPNGPYQVLGNFNLSAFVRDMIAEAGKS